jgi:hypothetical protein
MTIEPTPETQGSRVVRPGVLERDAGAGISLFDCGEGFHLVGGKVENVQAMRATATCRTEKGDTPSVRRWLETVPWKEIAQLSARHFKFVNSVLRSQLWNEVAFEITQILILEWPPWIPTTRKYDDLIAITNSDATLFERDLRWQAKFPPASISAEVKAFSTGLQKLDPWLQD